MGKKITIVLNHNPTEEQLKELREMGYDEYEVLQHPTIPPNAEMEEVEGTFNKMLWDRQYDALWIQGDYRFFAYAARFCRFYDIPLFIATTERKVIEEPQPDGSIKKTSVFKHVKFVQVA